MMKVAVHVAYEVVGRPTMGALVAAVNARVAAGWQAQGGPFQIAVEVGSRLALDRKAGVLWAQALVLPAEAARRMQAAHAGIEAATGAGGARDGGAAKQGESGHSQGRFGPAAKN